ncbi:MAG: hypothetical protein AAB473_03165 [Patescibacteria group bacterium]
MTDFIRAVEHTLHAIEGMADENQVARRVGLLEVIILAERQKATSLKIPKGEPNEGELMDIVVLNDEGTIRDYAADMRLVILVAALAHPDVLLYINNEFLPSINPANNSEAEATAAKIRETSNLAGLWELVRQESGSWLLQLVCPDGYTKPIHGTLLIC